MDQAGYEQSLLKAKDYFLQDKFSLFLDEFARAFEFNNDCFNDNLNVFRFSLASHSLTSNKTINEFNRFTLHLPEYLRSMKDTKDKMKRLEKVIKWTGTRYKIHFVYLPQKPKEFFKELEDKILSLRQKNTEH